MASEVVRIEIEYADGSIGRATGPDAAAIWGDILNMYVLRFVHGGRYGGPKMKLVELGKAEGWFDGHWGGR